MGNKIFKCTITGAGCRGGETSIKQILTARISKEFASDACTHCLANQRREIKASTLDYWRFRILARFMCARLSMKRSNDYTGHTDMPMFDLSIALIDHSTESRNHESCQLTAEKRDYELPSLIASIVSYGHLTRCLTGIVCRFNVGKMIVVFFKG